MQLAVAPLPGNGAGIPHPVARVEQRDLITNGLDDSGRIPTEHPDLSRLRRLARAYFRIYGVHRDGLDLGQDIAGVRHRIRQADVDQRFRMTDGEALPIANGFHSSRRAFKVWARTGMRLRSRCVAQNVVSGPPISRGAPGFPAWPGGSSIDQTS
jgi:hypothetical protein